MWEGLKGPGWDIVNGYLSQYHVGIFGTCHLYCLMCFIYLDDAERFTDFRETL